MVKTLKEAMVARDAFPDRVRVCRETRWYACVDGHYYELMPDRESEDVSRYIDERKKEKAQCTKP